MKLSTHLTFAGQCEAAFRFYEKCLGGTLGTMLTYGDSPMAEHVPADWRGKIVHASLTVDDEELAGADSLAKDYQTPRGFFVLLSLEGPEEAERIFQKLSENGNVVMPLEKTFWAARFGVLTDQFGIPWEINCAHASS